MVHIINQSFPPQCKESLVTSLSEHPSPEDCHILRLIDIFAAIPTIPEKIVETHQYFT